MIEHFIKPILAIKKAISSNTFVLIGVNLAFLMCLMAIVASFLHDTKSVLFHTFIISFIPLSILFFSWFFSYLFLFFLTSFLTNDLLFDSLDKPFKAKFYFKLSLFFNKDMRHYQGNKSFFNFLVGSKNWTPHMIELKKEIFNHIMSHQLYYGTDTDIFDKPSQQAWCSGAPLLIWFLESPRDDSEYQKIRNSLLTFDFLNQFFTIDVLHYCIKNNIHHLPSKDYGQTELFHLLCNSVSSYFRPVAKINLRNSLSDEFDTTPCDITFRLNNGWTYFDYLFHVHDPQLSCKDRLEALLSKVNIDNSFILDEDFAEGINRHYCASIYSDMIEQKKTQVQREKLEYSLAQGVKKKTIKI
jgi:hypothetical protein